MKKILLTLFTVFCCIALFGQNTITIDMVDSYGDGWQGAEISIYEYDATGCAQGGLVAGPFSIPNGGGGTAQATADLPDGCYIVIVSDDSYDNEVSWTMSDASATVLLSGGSNFEDNLNVNGTCPVSGCTDPAASNYDPLATCDDGSCLAGCPSGESQLIIDMVDSFGDGWQGAEISVYEYDVASCGQGALAGGPFSIPDGGGDTAQEVLCLTDGCYVVVVSDDQYDNEVFWNMSDASATVLLSGGSNFDDNLGFNSTCLVSGCTNPAASNYDPLANCDDGSCILCGAPTSVAVNVAATTADITWTDGAGCSANNTITVSPAITGSPFMVACGTEALSLSGLTEGTEYTLTLANDCGTLPSETITFSTGLVGCGITITDSGGAGGDYSAYENIPTLICPDNPVDKVSIIFTAFNVEDRAAGTCWDALKIYDGSTDSDPQIGATAGFCYDGSGTGGTGYPGGALGVPITSTHASGCLYMVFISDGSEQRPGWEAMVTCDATCDPTANVATIGSTSAGGPSSGVCYDAASGYTYYEDPNNTGSYMFAVKWNAAGNGRNDAGSAVVTIQKDAMPNSASDAAAGSFFMGRQWDVSGVTLQYPVDVKFFYDPAEKMAAEMAASSHAAANSIPYNGWEWFKSNGVSVDYSAVTTAAFVPDVYLTGVDGMENGQTYVEFIGVTSFSTGSGGGGSGGSGLPVEFISFTGKAKGNTNVLDWATASEINSSFYEVQRATDGRNYVKIGNVEAAGNSVEVLNYQFEDRNPIKEAYYRLKQVDIDGTYDYSDVVHIERSIEEDLTIGQVRPNPAKTFATLEFNSGLAGTINITLTNVDGKIVSNRSMEAVSGLNQVDLDLSTIATGVYFVTVSNNSTKSVTRIVKSN